MIRFLAHLMVTVYVVISTALGLAVGYLYGSFEASPHGEVGTAASAVAAP